MFNKAYYFMIQTALVLISPISSFIVSLRFYRQPISQLFILIFAFYFGYNRTLGWDLENHFIDLDLYYGNSLSEILANPAVYYKGSDYYHILFKFIFSRFSHSTQLFAGCAALGYYACFLFFFRQLSRFYNNYKGLLFGILLIASLFVIEFTWYDGLRFYTGVYYFMAWYMAYVNTKKKVYLLLSFTCLFFHYGLSVLVISAVLNEVMRYTGILSRFVFLGFSFIIRFSRIDFIPWLKTHLPNIWFMQDKLAYKDDRIRNNVLEYLAWKRDKGNIVYQNRVNVLLAFGLMTLFIYYRLGVKWDNKYKTLLFMSLTVFSCANLGFVDLTFYERFFRITVMLLYVFIYVTACLNYDKIKSHRYRLILIMFIPMVFEILTPLVASRSSWTSNLFFGNFFTSGIEGQMIWFPQK